MFPELKKQSNAFLFLEDSTVFTGFSFGAKKNASGEVVFNTGMVGYNESLTDPSYEGQILVFTYPLIGNYGVPKLELKNNLTNFFESERIHVKGIVVADYSNEFSHWNARLSLSDWLKLEGVPGITAIDTRALTKKLREKGTMLGSIVTMKGKHKRKFFDPNKENLVSLVSTKKPLLYKCGSEKAKTIVLLDCGVKHSIIRMLLKRNLNVFRVPWNYDVFDKGFDFHGIVISNGPGNPVFADKTIKIVEKSLEYGMPTFGICLGHQIIALAAGAKTYKLKFGHRSQNQPCIKSNTGQCIITSQNHGFAVDTKTLPFGWKQWFYNANDKTNEGLIHERKPFMSVQFHPEASPGPNDAEFIFDKFLKVLK